MNISKSDIFTLSSAREYKSCKIRVLIITPYEIVRESLKMLIEDSLGIMVTTSVSNLNNLSEYTNLKNPDVVLIYLMDKDCETVEIISKLKKIYPKTRIIVATSCADSTNQIRAIQLGAIGIFEKEGNAAALITIIKEAYRGKLYGNQSLLDGLSSYNSAESENTKAKSESAKHYDFGLESITKREKEVIAMIGEGLNNKDIAQKLFISLSTIRQHLGSIFRKLEVVDRVDLVIYAYQHGLLQFPE